MEFTKEELSQIHENAIVQAYAPAARLEVLKRKKLLTVKETSELYGVSESTLAKRRMRGLAPAWLKVGGSVRYRHEDIEQYVNFCIQKTIN
ncbi:AlpA family transcriptional regulator [Halodesulfovibrio sp. MK-HDV]|jgi:predicted DNA-binding transcriptional regulator AlpA|uniref:helix-turn-helix transcriptional regulator n=1 Tax=Halodesulfovibrio sp. MK-HDV TaxID=2599925 RepID=UPI00136F3C67|nr:helix-turn-helix domain-containing protein [Halodesulfovibrio sp. MK-HDV]KAF1077625.1 hypothetical protein MKHDV_00081 [Halodesulfovibrio sp. MK-HDV]